MTSFSHTSKLLALLFLVQYAIASNIHVVSQAMNSIAVPEVMLALSDTSPDIAATTATVVDSPSSSDEEDRPTSTTTSEPPEVIDISPLDDHNASDDGASHVVSSPTPASAPDPATIAAEPTPSVHTSKVLPDPALPQRVLGFFKDTMSRLPFFD